MMRGLAAILSLAAAPALAAPSTGRHWQVDVASLECQADGGQVVAGLRIRYLGAAGLAESPVVRLGGALPKSVVWKGGNRDMAAWIAKGGLRQVGAGADVEMQFRFDRPGAFALEFGDVEPIALSRDGCKSLLKPAEVRAVRAPARSDNVAREVRVHRGDYPCRPPRGVLRMVEAQNPPELPVQLLVFGRGYLPNLREVALPMGKARAQSYAYAGINEPAAVDAMAKRTWAADFPKLASGASHYLFDWGQQVGASGNLIYSYGIYAVRPCAGT